MTLRSKNFNDIVTFTRDSIGTFVDSDGLIKTALADQPRFDHDPSTFVPEANNLLLYSGELTNAVYLFVDTSVTDNGQSPIPDINSYIVREGTDNNISSQVLQTLNVPTGTYTLSIFVKKQGVGEERFIALSPFGRGARGNNASATFDLNGNVISLNTGAGIGSITKTSTEDFGDYVRISATGSITSGGDVDPGFIIVSDPNVNTNSGDNRNGDGVSGFEVFGFQFEEGDKTTAYIKTVDSPVSRPVTLAEPLGLLVEESRTNIENNSLDLFSQSTRERNNGILSEEVGFFENSKASKYEILLDGQLQRLFVSSHPTTTDQTYSCSAFLKGNCVTDFIPLNDPSGSVKVDLTTGEIISIFNGQQNVTTTAKIEKYKNGWYRVSVTTVAKGNLTIIKPEQVDGKFVIISDLQIEAGTFPTSYIPTNGSQVTRVSDQAVIDGERFSQFYNADEGTILIDVNPFDVTNFNTGIGFGKGGLGLIAGGTDIRFDAFGIFFSQPANRLVRNRIAIRYKKGEFTRFFNLGEERSVVDSLGRNKLYDPEIHAISQISLALGTEYNEIKFFPRALTDLELIQLTSTFDVQTAEVDTTQDPSFEADFINDSSTVAEA